MSDRAQPGHGLTEQRFTRRQYLTYTAIMDGVDRGMNFPEARDAVAITALEHPEWDMDEELTWEQWQAETGSS